MEIVTGGAAAEETTTGIMTKREMDGATMDLQEGRAEEQMVTVTEDVMM
jgi:hypothetical protein